MGIARVTVEVLCMLGICASLGVAQWNLLQIWRLGPPGRWGPNLIAVLFCPGRFNEQQRPHRKLVVRAALGFLACCLLAVAIGAARN